MNRLTFPNDVVRIEGALDLRSTARGVSPRRLPSWSDSRIADAFLEFDVAATAGVRLRFATASASISLTLVCNALRIDELSFAAAVDLVVGGVFVERRVIEDVGRIPFEADTPLEVIGGAPTTVTFEGLGLEPKLVELWLPHTGSTELISIETSEPIARVSERRPRWIHYGSSISHCLEVAGPADAWPARVALEHDLDLLSLGFAGQAVLDPFVARAIRDTAADAISLCLGINIVGDKLMRERTFRAAIEGFLDVIREGHPLTPLLVVSAISSPRYETSEVDGELSLARSREVLAEVVERRIAEGEDIRYLDGRALLGPDEVDDLPDGVHPTPEAYARIARRFVALGGV